MKKSTLDWSFFIKKNRFLDVPLRRRLCNALPQPHFYYSCTAWYPNSSKKLKDKLQVAQNNCIRFCLKLYSREHISNEHFHKMNWLPRVYAFCRSIRIMPVYMALPKPFNILSLRNDRNRSVEWLFLKPDWYL